MTFEFLNTLENFDNSEFLYNDVNINSNSYLYGINFFISSEFADKTLNAIENSMHQLQKIYEDFINDKIQPYHIIENSLEWKAGFYTYLVMKAYILSRILLNAEKPVSNNNDPIIKIVDVHDNYDDSILFREDIDRTSVSFLEGKADFIRLGICDMTLNNLKNYLKKLKQEYQDFMEIEINPHCGIENIKEFRAGYVTSLMFKYNVINIEIINRINYSLFKV